MSSHLRHPLVAPPVPALLPQSHPSALSRTPTHLDEADEVSLLTESLTADVEAVLADETVVVAGDTAGARALAVLAGVAEPNVGVGHLEGEAGEEGTEGEDACELGARM